jgi:DNA-binding protein H-NS
MHDPAEEFEQAETLQEQTSQAVEDVRILPRRQQQAMIWAIKERAADLLQISEAFARYNINITDIHNPTTKVEHQRLQASLCIAQKKMNAMRKSYLVHHL